MKPPETQLPDGDPQLKAALRRVFGSETAPESLRKRVAELSAASAGTASIANKSRVGIPTILKMGLAVGLLGFAGWRLMSFVQENDLLPPYFHLTSVGGTPGAVGAGCGSSTTCPAK